MFFEVSGLVAGQSGEFLLDVVDAFCHLSGPQAGLVSGEVVLLGWAEDPCVEEPLVGGGGLVVEAFAAADVVGGVADGLLGGGEVVQPIIGQCPELVE